MLVNGNFSPQTNKKNVVFIFMRFEILAVSLTPLTPTFSPDFICISPYSLSTLLLSFPLLPLSSLFFFFPLLSSTKLWIPTGPRENSHVSNMSPFSGEQMNKSRAKTRAGKIIT